MKLYKVLSKFPYWAQEIPYYVAFYILKIAYYRLPLQIWCRNSFKQKNIVCALSDLDLTFFEHRHVQTNIILKRYFFLKRFLPYIGEINYYSSNEIKTFIPFANFFELQRDPLLIQNINFKSTKEDSLQKIVFFCKTLISDKKNLLLIPRYRTKKWVAHSKNLNFDLEKQFDLNSLIHNLYRMINDHYCFDKSFLNDFYKVDLEDKKSINKFYLSNPDKKSFIVLYPFFWIGASFSHDSFYHDLEIISKLEENESELLLEQIRAEIWGLYSQYRITKSQVILISHLNNIKAVIKKIPLTDEKKEAVIQIIEELNKLCNQKIENEN